jgi:hypothetical protein
MRTYQDIIDDYLFWYVKETGKTEYYPEYYFDVSDEEKSTRFAKIWAEILKLCYHKDNGLFWFHKFILGDMQYAGYPEPIRFNNLFLSWMRLIPQADHIAIKCARQHGKAQPYSSKIITPNGWTTMGELQIGDEVFSEKGTTTKVINIFEQGEKDVYKITFTDGSSTECELNHLWKVKKGGMGRNGKEKLWKIKTLKEIIEDHGMNPVSDKAYRIPLTQPVEFKENKHYIDPYTLGALIGDGRLTHGSCIITSNDEEIINNIQEKMPQLKISNTKKYKYVLIDKRKNSSSKIITELKRLGLMNTKSQTKFIPKEYLYDSVENRIELLRGLMDTDGCISDTCVMEYYSISERLCKQVKELVQSLGGKARIYLKNGSYKGEKRQTYRVKIWMQNINPFKITRKAKHFYNIRYKPVRIIKKIELLKKEKCRCIMVDDETHTYLTDNYIVTHNSSFWTVINTIYRTALYKNYNILISSASEDQAIDLMAYIIRIIENNEFLVSKKAQNTKWSTTQITYNSGKIIAKGIGSEVRGGTYDLIICDDILRSDNKYSDDDVERYIDEELEPMLIARKGQLIIVGTPKSSTDIFSTIEERIYNSKLRPWLYKKYPAILNWEKKILLCPDRFTWEQLMSIRERQTHMKFDKEFQCECYSSGSQLFPQEYIDTAKEQGREYSVHPSARPEDVGVWHYYIGVDTARSGSASADYTVVMVLAYNPATQMKRVVWFWREKGMRIQDQVAKIAEISQAFNNPIVLVEKNNIGQDFIDLLVANYNITVESFTTGGTGQRKDDLIRALVNVFETEKMIFPTKTKKSREMIQQLEIELSRFVVEITPAGNERMKGSGKAKDDSIIALALANRCTQSYGYTPFVASYDRKLSAMTDLERFAETGDFMELLQL